MARLFEDVNAVLFLPDCPAFFAVETLIFFKDGRFAFWAGKEMVGR